MIITLSVFGPDVCTATCKKDECEYRNPIINLAYKLCCTLEDSSLRGHEDFNKVIFDMTCYKCEGGDINGEEKEM